MNKLVETLQARIAELEKKNTELECDCHRYENGRVIMKSMIDELTKQLLEARAQKA